MPAKTKKDPVEELKEERQFMAALLSEAHAIAVKQFGAEVAPSVSLDIMAFMSESEDDNEALVEDLGKAAVVSQEIFGEHGKDPKTVMEVLQTVFGYSFEDK